MVEIKQQLSQKQTLSPQKILQAQLLQLNTANLEERIFKELEENPVFEQVSSAPSSEDGENNEIDDSLDISTEYEDYEPGNYYGRSGKSADFSLPENPDFVESLLEQLKLMGLNDFEKNIAEEILWNLDELGFLATDLDVIANRFEMEGTEIEHLLKAVQHLEPAGIAARDLRECLLIQLEDSKNSTAFTIIKHYFEDFSNRRFDILLEKTNIANQELEAAIKVISRLNPRPGEGIKFTKDEIVIPDLIVRMQNEKWSIYNNDSGIPELRVNPDYVAMLEEESSTKTETHIFLKKRFNSAQWFIQAIEQRRQTMKRVMQSIIDHQPDFFSGRTDSLRPLKLMDIANDLDLDVSTISRSTRGKYVDTPFGIFELKSYFTEGIQLDDGRMVSNQKIKNILKEIINGEDKQNPMNDQRLADELGEQGYVLSRRTIAKYREQLHVPVSRLRKQF